MPDYVIPGLKGTAGAVVSYILSAVIGAGIAGIIAYVLTRILMRRGKAANRDIAEWK
jgi:phosphate/sulfate permease